MKKLIAVFAVLLFVAPAFAADWAFYGSQRVAPGIPTRISATANYRCQRPGQRLRHPMVSPGQLPPRRQGQGRQGHRPDRTGDDGLRQRRRLSDQADGAVNTRRAYGQWKFSDNASLKVGKDYSPATDFISNQWFDADNDLFGDGQLLRPASGRAHPGIGDFELAFLAPQQGFTGGISSTTTGI